MSHSPRFPNIYFDNYSIMVLGAHFQPKIVTISEIHVSEIFRLSIGKTMQYSLDIASTQLPKARTRRMQPYVYGNPGCDEAGFSHH